jgi:hypothetical protein
MASTDSGNDRAAADFLAEALEKLLSLPLDTPEDAERWEVECADVEAGLERRFPGFTVEDQVWHFFSDSDIRQKDGGYRQRQHQAITDYVTRLRRGN